MNNKPFLLKPSGKDYIWGGNRLNDDFNKNIDMSPLAETWECSTHNDGPSIVCTGKNSGKTLKQVLQENPDYLGKHANPDGDIPILIKFIDAKKDLSIQVHPSDEYAKEYENGQLGKTEMWYVLDAFKNARIVYGFKHDMDAKKVESSLNNNTLMKYLNTINIKKDDVFYVKSGTVHAIGAGALIAEIQENSNLTYRLYDYDRTDKNGNKRELHISKALDVLNYSSTLKVNKPMLSYNYKKGSFSEFVCRCKYFEVYREIINTQNCKDMYSFNTRSDYFQVMLCVDGCGTLIFDGETINYYKGDCIFIPANSTEIKIHGVSIFLKVKC
jgi:mannose-6-phosphate isomerase